MKVSVLRLKSYFPKHLLMSALNAIRCKRNFTSIVVRREYRLGPVSSRSLREVPEDELADASKTARSLVVVDESLKTP